MLIEICIAARASIARNSLIDKASTRYRDRVNAPAIIDLQ